MGQGKLRLLQNRLMEQNGIDILNWMPQNCARFDTLMQIRLRDIYIKTGEILVLKS